MLLRNNQRTMKCVPTTNKRNRKYFVFRFLFVIKYSVFRLLFVPTIVCVSCLLVNKICCVSFIDCYFLPPPTLMPIPDVLALSLVIFFQRRKLDSYQVELEKLQHKEFRN